MLVLFMVYYQAMGSNVDTTTIANGMRSAAVEDALKVSNRKYQTNIKHKNIKFTKKHKPFTF